MFYLGVAAASYNVQYFPGGQAEGVEAVTQSYPGSQGKQSSRVSDPREELKVPDGQAWMSVAGTPVTVAS
jgi:hypothetical protein